MSDLRDAYPVTVGDMVRTARSLISEHDAKGDVPSLFAMLLASSHVADWFARINHRTDFAEIEEGWFAAQFPVWDPIREMANRLKHAKRISANILFRKDTASSLDLLWENPGFWHGEVWAFQWEEKWLSVSQLCRLFLDDFEGRSSKLPRPPKRKSAARTDVNVQGKKRGTSKLGL